MFCCDIFVMDAKNCMSNSIKCDNEKKDKSPYAPLMMFPVLFCYYGFLFWLIYEKRKYGLNINIMKLNMVISMLSLLVVCLILAITKLLGKIFKNFEGSIYDKVINFIFIILAYIIMSAGFASLWLFNI